MYNYQAPPAQYGQASGPPGYQSHQQSGPPGMSPPSGMGPPPGVSAPGAGPNQSPTTPQQGGFPQQFQPPPNMPNINFSAPVIRLSAGGPPRPEQPNQQPQGDRKNSNYEPLGHKRGAGLGWEGRDGQRGQHHQAMQGIQPLTYEEKRRTIFVGDIPESLGGDEGLAFFLNVAGGLRRWTRAVNAENKPLDWGFAEYMDLDSLYAASEVLQDLHVPKRPEKKLNGLQVKTEEKEVGEDEDMKDGEDEKSDKDKVLVIVDPESLKYVEELRNASSLADPQITQKRIDDSKANLANMLEDIGRSLEHEEKPTTSTDQEGDVKMEDGETKTDAVTGEVVTIPLSGEDELADIPAEMRETVGKEIAAFRDRSNRRDMDRLRREEEQEKSNSFSNYANARLKNAEAGPGVQGAPTGPKGYQGSQLPRDYQKGVTFVNGTGISGLNPADEESDASDEELEQRRKETKDDEAMKAFLDHERRWLNRERSRAAALEREKGRDDEEEANVDKEKAAVAARLKEWNDDVEASRKVEEYYADRGQWLRNRSIFRERETMEDHQDRLMEERERAREREKQDRARGAAEDFLARQAQEMEARAEQPREPQRFKMSLGAAAQKAQAGQRRTVAEAEVLLEDEDDADASAKKRTLVPLNLEAISDTAGLSDEERQSAVKQLASEIPSDKDGLWNWDVKWDFVDDSIIADQLRPFVEKKIVEYLGVQEQMLVDVVEEHIKKRGKPQDLVVELEGALDEEAEGMVKKLWRMLIFFSETEKRGLSG